MQTVVFGAAPLKGVLPSPTLLNGPRLRNA